ncbi:histone deacetylase family protein [Nanoarchaeota archaeon]
MKLISSKKFLKHKLEGHVESPERIVKLLKKLEFEEAKDGELHLSLAHTPEYIEKVKATVAMGGGFLDSGDTYVDKDTYDVACHAVGAAVKAGEYALKGKEAFALVRPPGHHAHPSYTGGFCIFNNMAIAAAYIAGKGKRVLIFDFDMHRGDGTQACVGRINDDVGKRLYYLSINQRAVFPGASLDEGQIKNLYVESGISEKDYIKLVKEELGGLMKSFKPDIIALSAGFDSFANDTEKHSGTLGCGLLLTKKFIVELKKLIGKKSYFCVLEGGYDPESIKEGLMELMGERK